MNRQDFLEGSVNQIIFDFWDEAIDDWEFEALLNAKSKEDLIDFIASAQSKGRFGGGYIHD